MKKYYFLLYFCFIINSGLIHIIVYFNDNNINIVLKKKLIQLAIIQIRV